MAIVVFDLDMTIIDSSHRHASNADGSVDLAHWFENATPEKIAADTFLPLAKAVRAFHNVPSNEIILCTSRQMQEADWAFIARHFDVIPHHHVYSRPHGDMRADGVIKLEQLKAHCAARGFKSFREAQLIIFEDNLKTIDLLTQHGAIGINAVNVNKRMAA